MWRLRVPSERQAQDNHTGHGTYRRTDGLSAYEQSFCAEREPRKSGNGYQILATRHARSIELAGYVFATVLHVVGRDAVRFEGVLKPTLPNASRRKAMEPGATKNRSMSECNDRTNEDGK